MIQGYAVEELHHHEGATVFLTDVMNGADVGIVQGGSRLCLAPRSQQRLRVAAYPPQLMTQGKVLIDLFRLICVLGKWPKNRLIGS